MKRSKILSILALVIVMVISLIVTACGDLAMVEIQMDKETFTGSYVVGEEIDYSNIRVKAVYEDESVAFFNLTDEGVTYTPIDTSTVGMKEFKVTVKGISIVLNVMVNPALKNIEIFNAKTNYALNEDVDYSAILLKAIYGDDSESFIKLSADGVTYNQIDTSTAGEKTFTVEYMGKTANLTMVVSAPTVKSIEIDSGVKAEYKVGEAFNASEVKIKVVKDDADSTVEYVYLNDAGVSYSIDLTSQGEKTLSVTYGGITIVKVVNVVAVLQKIEFVSEDIVLDYKSAVDYSKIFINAIYNDANVNKVISLVDEGVAIIEAVDTMELGKHTLTVSYQGKQASIQVEVKKAQAIAPINFTVPRAYGNFKALSAVKEEALITEDEFAIKGKEYIVGSVNKFKFVPVATYIDVLTGIVEIENPVTTYELQIKGENGYQDVDESIYLSSVANNMYDFTDDAIGKSFKLIVRLDKEIYDLSSFGNVSPTATIEFKVENAYNVYDVYGLSVMDNLNVKNWAKIKNRTLVYDDKKLSEYTDVTLIVLHNDVSVDADKLPNNYFWDEYMTGYDLALNKAKMADQTSSGKLGFAGKLKGSLRDGTGDGNNYNHTTAHNDDANSNIYDEDGDGIKEDFNETTYNAVNMQKGLFVTNQCSISGNYMSITTKDSATRRLSSVISRDFVTNNALKMTNPISHWFMFKFFKTGSDKLSVSMENVFVKGNMPKVNESGLTAGLMAVNSLVDNLTLDNVRTSQFYTHLLTDEVEGEQSSVTLKNSRMIDAYSNMIYLWKSNVVIENSIIKNAGGPLFILCDDDRPVTDTTSPSAVLTVDDKSILESYAAGTEAWYTIFDATLLFKQFKDMNTLMNATFNKNYVHNVKSAEQINLIAVVIPQPGSITSSRSNDNLISIKGKVVRGDEVYDICDPVVETIKAYGSAGFVSNGQYAFMPTPTSIAPCSILNSAIPSDFTKSSDWLSVTMSAASLGISNAPYFSVIIGDFKDM